MAQSGNPNFIKASNLTFIAAGIGAINYLYLEPFNQVKTSLSLYLQQPYYLE